MNKPITNAEGELVSKNVYLQITKKSYPAQIVLQQEFSNRQGTDNP